MCIDVNVYRCECVDADCQLVSVVGVVPSCEESTSASQCIVMIIC